MEGGVGRGAMRLGGAAMGVVGMVVGSVEGGA